MYACYIVYNSADVIATSLRSIIPYVEKVIMIDGAFKNYPHIEIYSTDNTKEIAQQICGDKLIWVDCPLSGWEDQVEKRNAYLKLVPDEEWFFVLDDDVVVFGDLNVTLEQLPQISQRSVSVRMMNLYPAKMVRQFPDKTFAIRWIWDFLEAGNALSEKEYDNLKWVGGFGYVNCLYRKHRDMEYRFRHCSIYIGNTLIYNPNYLIVANGIISLNAKFLTRYEEYLNDFNYKNIRMENERVTAKNKEKFP